MFVAVYPLLYFFTTHSLVNCKNVIAYTMIEGAFKYEAQRA